MYTSFSALLEYFFTFTIISNIFTLFNFGLNIFEIFLQGTLKMLDSLLLQSCLRFIEIDSMWSVLSATCLTYEVTYD